MEGTGQARVGAIEGRIKLHGAVELLWNSNSVRQRLSRFWKAREVILLDFARFPAVVRKSRTLALLRFWQASEDES